MDGAKAMMVIKFLLIGCLIRSACSPGAEKNEVEVQARETEMVIEQDRQYVEQEKQRQIDRAKFLLQFTMKNKEVRRK